MATCKILGPNYGFYINDKTKLLVNRNPQANLKEVNCGQEVLGSPIGNDKFVEVYCQQKCKETEDIIDKLILMTKLFPQHAFHLYSQSVKFRVYYLMKTVPNAHIYAKDLKNKVVDFINALFGSPLDNEKMHK